jgi:hypothetical protein
LSTALRAWLAAALYCLVMLVICIPSWCLSKDVLTVGSRGTGR